ncbi:MAG TPA: sulfatase [Marmoricola sp.]|nr:sulfatase [Marmoricola sp.]
MTPETGHVRHADRRSPWRLQAALIVVVALLAALVGCSGSAPRKPVAQPPLPPGDRPNIVFVLTDDLTADLVRFMPHVRAMQRDGMSFTNYSVTDSQCCPSRSSIFTGRYPHNTGVLTNDPPWGGYAKFQADQQDQSTFAVALHNAGYRTGFMGKYLNGYHPGSSTRQADPVPPGWDEWDGVGWGYNEYNYDIAHNTTTKHYGHRPQDYLTTVLQHRATDYIGSVAHSGQPFFLEVASFTPHMPYVPAPQDTHAFKNLTAPRTAAWDTLPTNPPAWLASRAPLTDAQISGIDRRFRLRARDVLSLDRLLGAIEDALYSAGASKRTIVVFSSDNGYHLGQYRLTAGKMTAFDTDVVVPLVFTGPDIRPGTTNADVVQNIDLAPTFEQLAGLRPNRHTMDGSSLVGLLHQTGTHRGSAALVEHHGQDNSPNNPDNEGPDSANPPSYEALRTATFTYVKYTAGGAEFYDRRVDPFELNNIISQLSPQRRARLHHWLVEMSRCQGVAQCTATPPGGL